MKEIKSGKSFENVEQVCDGKLTQCGNCGKFSQKFRETIFSFINETEERFDEIFFK